MNRFTSWTLIGTWVCFVVTFGINVRHIKYNVTLVTFILRSVKVKHHLSVGSQNLINVLNPVAIIWEMFESNCWIKKFQICGWVHCYKYAGRSISGNLQAADKAIVVVCEKPARLTQEYNTIIDEKGSTFYLWEKWTSCHLTKNGKDSQKAWISREFDGVKSTPRENSRTLQV